MSGLLKLTGLALVVWLAVFYALEVVATMLHPYHSSGGLMVLAILITLAIGYSLRRK